MKKIKYYLLAMLASVGFTACSDFLDRYPLDAMSGESYFKRDTDLKFYMNGLYGGVVRVRGNNSRYMLTSNMGSDDVMSNTPHASLMRHSISGIADNTSKVWNDAYDYVRKVNYFLENAYRVPESKKANHYIGEGYYCRASKYFDLLVEFGGVPYLTKTLNTDSRELYLPRENRRSLAEHIIADLDSAILKLDWKGSGEAVSGRINKETALVMKTRVALFEGTWEYYHGKKETPFQVKGKNGLDLLLEVLAAGDQLIAKHGNNVYKGNNGSEYYDYFNQLDYAKTTGAFLFRACSRELGVYDWLLGDYVTGYSGGLTHSAVNSYLMKDGRPIELSIDGANLTTLNKLVENKDPRLGQTIWSPNKGRFHEYWPTMTNAYKTSYPGLIQNQQREPSYSGYRIWKGTLPYITENEDGNADDLIIRYEEALLNYAEAKAVLGTITQPDIDKTVNLLRSRVGMVPMVIADVNSWNLVYSKQDGFDPQATNLLNEIRRERRVELMLEGFRVRDIKRWALYDDVFNGTKPVGARVQEFLDYWNDPEKLKADEFEYDPKNVVLTMGGNVDAIDGYINPFFKNADFKPTTGRGYYINPGRDYLNSIPNEEIQLYKDKANVILEQNPGWF